MKDILEEIIREGVMFNFTDYLWHHGKGQIDYFWHIHKKKKYCLYINTKNKPYTQIASTMVEAMTGELKPFWSFDKETRKLLYDTYKKYKTP